MYIRRSLAGVPVTGWPALLRRTVTFTWPAACLPAYYRQQTGPSASVSSAPAPVRSLIQSHSPATVPLSPQPQLLHRSGPTHSPTAWPQCQESEPSAPAPVPGTLSPSSSPRNPQPQLQSQPGVSSVLWSTLCSLQLGQNVTAITAKVAWQEPTVPPLPSPVPSPRLGALAAAPLTDRGALCSAAQHRGLGSDRRQDAAASVAADVSAGGGRPGAAAALPGSLGLRVLQVGDEERYRPAARPLPVGGRVRQAQVRGESARRRWRRAAAVRCGRVKLGFVFLWMRVG